MKNLFYLLALILISSCSCKKDGLQAQTIPLSSTCPKDGKCSTQLLKNKSMDVKRDDFGKTYYNLIESTTQNVILYTYSRTVKGNLQDAGYREEIVFEINNDLNNITLTNESLQKTKMLFGRFCFCRGQTGYYKLTMGNLIISEKAKVKTVTLNFKTDEVPQIVNNVNFVIK